MDVKLNLAQPGGHPFACLLRINEVCLRTGHSRAELYRRVAAGKFPSPVKLGKRSSAWSAAEVERYIVSLIAVRDAQVAA